MQNLSNSGRLPLAPWLQKEQRDLLVVEKRFRSLIAPVVGQRRGNANIQGILDIVHAIAVSNPSRCLYNAEI